MKCLYCEKEIKRIVEDSTSPPQVDMWDDAGVHEFVPGYGSKYDTIYFVIGLCDDCIGKLLDKGLITKKPEEYVVHCKRDRYDVYIGRPSKWGNPFVIGKDGDRNEVIQKYRGWLMSKPELIKEARKELKGKVLGCWCAPYACHGDVLAEVANS